jgi:hypothetical protein
MPPARQSRRASIVSPSRSIPAIGPATKPKALNGALPLARGTFTVVYDAEDRPERNQLRAALNAFRSAGEDLACVQARLCIDTRTSWLARYFTAEYAGHFDNMQDTSTCFFQSSPPSVCRCRLAAPRTISGQQRCAKSVAGTLTTLLKMPISACDSRALLPIGRDRIQHLRRSACRCRPLARPADTLVQGLGCRPPAVPAFPRAWTWRLSCLSAHRRRQCAGATGTPDFHVANDLRTIGIPLARGLFGSSDRALSTHHRDRLIAFGVNRLFWLGAARHAEKGRSSCFNAATLVAAFDRSVVGSR